MSEKGAMKQNLCLDKTVHTQLAAEAIKPVLRKPYFVTGNWAYGVDTDNGDILVFFQLNKIKQMGFGVYHFDVELKKAWRNAGFKVIEKVELPKYEYNRVGFESLCYRLQRIFYEAP